MGRFVGALAPMHFDHPFGDGLPCYLPNPVVGVDFVAMGWDCDPRVRVWVHHGHGVGLHRDVDLVHLVVRLGFGDPRDLRAWAFPCRGWAYPWGLSLEGILLVGPFDLPSLGVLRA